MSRLTPLALLATTLAAPVAAQSLESRSARELRALVARADSELAVYAARREAVERASAPGRSARVTRSGAVAVVTWESVAPAAARALAEGADSVLRASGVIPVQFVAGLAFVMPRTLEVDAALAAAGAGPRRHLGLELPMSPEPFNARPDGVLSPLVRAFGASLDSAWNAWAQTAWKAVTRQAHQVAQGGLRELADPTTTAGEQCLAGLVQGCRRYLGLDADAEPYRIRYTPAELRAEMEDLVGSRDVAACRAGDDEACVRAAATVPYTGLDGVPAGSDARASLLAAVAALYGPAALRRALQDSVGSRGERLARASGQDLDAVVLAWRAWTLSGGRPERVSAGLGDLLAAGILVSLLVFLSTRSGRWR